MKPPYALFHGRFPIALFSQLACMELKVLRCPGQSLPWRNGNGSIHYISLTFVKGNEMPHDKAKPSNYFVCRRPRQVGKGLLHTCHLPSRVTPGKGTQKLSLLTYAAEIGGRAYHGVFCWVNAPCKSAPYQ